MDTDCPTRLSYVPTAPALNHPRVHATHMRGAKYYVTEFVGPSTGCYNGRSGGYGKASSIPEMAGVEAPTLDSQIELLTAPRTVRHPEHSENRAGDLKQRSSRTIIPATALTIRGFAASHGEAPTVDPVVGSASARCTR